MLDGGHCPTAAAAGLDASGVRALFGGFVRLDSYRPIIPALAYRLRRCAPSDVTALTRLAERFVTPDPSTTPSPDSTILYSVIVRSELWDDRAITSASLALAHQAQLFAMRFDMLDGLSLSPTYPRPAEADVFPATEIPMLLLNGTSDAQTPTWSSDPAGAHYRAPHQHYVVLDRVTHGTLLSPSTSGSGESCAARLMRQFLSDPTGALDTSCRTQAPPFAFDGAGLGFAFFGTSDLYENELAPARVTPAEAARADAMRRRARELIHRGHPFAWP
jgi:pimeloyl-ACP methyl ester carboxylesterase